MIAAPTSPRTSPLRTWPPQFDSGAVRCVARTTITTLMMIAAVTNHVGAVAFV